MKSSPIKWFYPVQVVVVLGVVLWLLNYLRPPLPVSLVIMISMIASELALYLYKWGLTSKNDAELVSFTFYLLGVGPLALIAVFKFSDSNFILALFVGAVASTLLYFKTSLIRAYLDN